MASALMPAFSVACVLLVVGGVLKLRAPRPGRESLALAGIRVPAWGVRVLGAVEVIVGVAAAFAPGPLTSGLVAIAYGGFCGFAARLLLAGTTADCGCFGGNGARIGATHLALNAIGLVVASLAAVVSAPGLGSILAHSPLESVALALGLAAASFAIYSVFTLFPSAWRSYGAS